jgi:hypothetical protein
MQMLGDHSMRPQSLSPKTVLNSAPVIETLSSGSKISKKADLLAQCRDAEIVHDSIEMADSPGIESGSKLRPLKGVN